MTKELNSQSRFDHFLVILTSSWFPVVLGYVNNSRNFEIYDKTLIPKIHTFAKRTTTRDSSILHVFRVYEAAETYDRS